MEGLKIKTFLRTGDYYNQMQEIYSQSTISNGGLLDDRNIIDFMLDSAKKENYNLYTACAFDGDKLVGFAMLANCFVENELYVVLLAVDKAYQRKGVGKALLNYAVHHSKGYDRITSEALLKNTASVNTHFSSGFKCINERILYYGPFTGSRSLTFVAQPPKENAYLKDDNTIEL